MSSEKKPQWKQQYTELLGYSTVGIEMGAAVGIGVALGWLVEFKVFDGRYSPWLILFFMACGIAAAAKAFIRAARELRARYQGHDDGPGGDDQSGLG